MLLNATATLLLTFVATAAGGAQAWCGVCPVLIGVLFGAVFIHVGVQSTRGTARDTLGNGIGSLGFALLNGGFGVLLITSGIVASGTTGGRAGSTDALIAGIIGGSSLLDGIGLLAAGVLALVGRREYKAWRRAQKRQRANSGAGRGGIS
jgi:hypothetical protein